MLARTGTGSWRACPERASPPSPDRGTRPPGGAALAARDPPDRAGDPRPPPLPRRGVRGWGRSSPRRGAPLPARRPRHRRGRPPRPGPERRDFLGYPPRPFDAPETLVAAALAAGTPREAVRRRPDPLREAPRLDLEDRRGRRVDRHGPPRVERTVPRPMSTKRALLSVSDRTGLVDLATALLRHGFELVSTGGTAQHLVRRRPRRSTQVADITGFPEVFDGRVKTLHPALFGGVLFDRSVAAPRRAGEPRTASAPIDVVVVNLYPFEETVALRRGRPSRRRSRRSTSAARPSSGPPPRTPPTSRSSATRPTTPPSWRSSTTARGTSSSGTRKRLAAKVFRRTAAYDAAIAAWLAARTEGEAFPERLLALPSSWAATPPLRREPAPAGRPSTATRRPPPSALARFALHQGKELSYNNLLDADSALFTSRLRPPAP